MLYHPTATYRIFMTLGVECIWSYRDPKTYLPVGIVRCNYYQPHSLGQINKRELAKHSPLAFLK